MLIYQEWGMDTCLNYGELVVTATVKKSNLLQNTSKTGEQKVQMQDVMLREF